MKIKSIIWAVGFVWTALVSCSQSVLTEPEVQENIGQEAEQPVPVISLVDAAGNVLKQLPAAYQECFVRIHTEGAWQLEVDGKFLAPLRTEGQGPDLVPLFVGCNWSEARQGHLALHLFSDATTRSDGETVTLHAEQAATPDMEAVRKMISSNKGAGYSYQPHTNYCLGTNMQIFNMSRLDSLQKVLRYDLITDEYYPQVEEEVSTAASQEELSSKLSVAASVNLNFNVFSVDVKGHFGNASTNMTNKEYAVKRLKSYQFTREINYMNMVALVNKNAELRDEIYAPGFIHKVETFTKAVKAENITSQQKDELCRDFCTEVGPCFVSKSVMGCVLDYYISVDKSLLKNGMTAGGALDIKVKTSIGIKVSGEGEFSEDEKKVMENTEAKVTIRGGDVNEVCILATGGVLKNEQVLSWQQSVQPASAVMIDMKLVPIYLLIDDVVAHDVLKDYVDREASLDK